MPELGSLFMDGGCINGPISELDPKYRELLISYDIKTIVFIPLFLNDKFWGLFSIDDCKRELTFSEDNINILQSVSLMMASAIERNSLGAEIREVNMHAQILLDTNPLCCQLFDKNHKKIDCNQEAIRLFGFRDKQDFLERSHELYPEFQPDGQRSNEKIAGILHAVFKEGYRSFDWTYKLSDGTYMPAHATLIRVKYGNEYVVAGYTRDLREHNRMMQEIEYRNELISITNRVAFSLLTPIDIDDFEKSLLESMELLGRYSDVDRVQIWQNEEHDGILYYALRHEWLSKNGRVKAPAVGTKLPYTDSWKELLLRGKYINGPVSELLPEDRELMESIGLKSVLSIPLFSHGKLWGMFCMDDCVNERHFIEDEVNMLASAGLMLVNTITRLEQSIQLRKAFEQATVASKAKGDFLSVMSHEMRTPMNAIIGMTAIGKKTNDINQKNHALNKIGDASSHLLGVINDVLDMAKIEANKLELAPIEYSFEKMLQKVLAVANLRVD
jgi:GAF domain-containing protein